MLKWFLNGSKNTIKFFNYYSSMAIKATLMDKIFERNFSF